VTRLIEALQRAHALREQNRMGLQADAPACRLDEAPLPAIAAFDPALETVDLEPPPRASETRIRLAIFAVAGLILAILVGWYLLELQATTQPSKPDASGLKLEQRLSTQMDKR
jgi:hypothetical protein